MQHRDVADFRTLRIKRFLDLQRPAMRPGGEQRSMATVGKG
jgi:hypothetical protein